MRPQMACRTKENQFKVDDTVILYSRRFKNITATIKEIDIPNEIATVKTADETTHRVDFDEMQENPAPFELNDVTMNSTPANEEGEYRPVGRGYGKTRDAMQVVGRSLKRIEKELGKVRMPIVNIKYQSVDQRRWHNGFNALWEGDINFIVDFLDPQGVKHSSTVKVPVQNGLIQDIKYIYDNQNRKYAMSKEGMEDFLGRVNWITDDNSDKNTPNFQDESIFQNPGTVPAEAMVKHPSFIKQGSKFLNDNKVLDILNKVSNVDDDKKTVEAMGEDYTCPECGSKVQFDELGDRWKCTNEKCDWSSLYPPEKEEKEIDKTYHVTDDSREAQLAKVAGLQVELREQEGYETTTVEEIIQKM
ncbi:hypothetical protein LCGC14_2691690, partial [marine sediment metagenome]